MGSDERHKHDRDEHHVPEQHLAEVHEVEERPEPDGVERVLAVRRDPLGVKLLALPGRGRHFVYVHELCSGVSTARTAFKTGRVE